MRFLLLLSLLCLLHAAAHTQVYLQMERFGKPETVKFSPGTELTYRLTDQKEWETATLERILPEENRLLLGIHYLAPDEIGAIRSFHPRQWSRPLGNNLYLFGLSWSGFSLGAWVADRNDPYSLGDALVTATAFGTGFLIQKIFHHRTYRMGKKRRLRILDMRLK